MVYAIDLNDPTNNPLKKFGDIATLLNLFIPLITIGAAVIFLFMILKAAFTILTSGSNPEQVAKAQKTFTYAILGLFLVVSAYMVVKLLGVVLKVDVKL